ncbi:PTS sugar transporter subunit IIB [Alkalicella caledoniensis]|uniref:PTS sugar transporter subunit IIB n=1 Tax=Alkalicella caledoniensis TaxID=2731377 RepID=A0A7G9W7I8_ALKCA|nr:PTS sugar transporter subunit IIB [Alkalicella caledoniensis]QNO14650.1 PTS sugar transporter subunit IIB [Alkalicella caledoniensis]
MKKVMLICSAGMSTSLLVSKMQKEAEARGLDFEIWAVGTAGFKKEMSKPDVILLGPQVRFMKAEVTDLANGKPVDVIDTMAYGRVDGASVLNQVLKLLGQ